MAGINGAGTASLMPEPAIYGETHDIGHVFSHVSANMRVPDVCRRIHDSAPCLDLVDSTK